MKIQEVIRNSFNASARHYEAAAKIQNEIGERLFERLDYLKINPQYVLDLGCGPGLFSQHLKKRYPKACIIGIDLALNMLTVAKEKQRIWKKWGLVNGDMSFLPFQDRIFDLIFANQAIHWSPFLSDVLQELSRVLKIEGCFLFSTLGPDTFKEINTAFAPVDNFLHSNSFLDMHLIGDALQKEGFLDPVVDMEQIILHFRSFQQLIASLKAQGVKNINEKRNKGLTGKVVWNTFESNYQKIITAQGKYPLTYEVIYGQAWGGQKKQKGSMTEISIPISEIKRKLS